MSKEEVRSGVRGKVTRRDPPEGSVGQQASLRASSGHREVCLGEAGGGGGVSSCSRGRGMSLCLLPGFKVIRMVEFGQMSEKEI